MDPRPNLFVVGAPRSGSTALHTYLAEHPDVFMSKPKEPHFFCTDIHRTFQNYKGGGMDPLIRTEERYLRIFRDAKGRRIVGESSVYYLYSPEAARGINAFNPESKIVILLREPIEFMRSLHNKLRWAGDEDQPDFVRALELEESRRRGENVPALARFPDILFYTHYARFAHWLELYRGVFGRDRVKVILLDDFHARTEEVYHDLLRFLGVDAVPLPEWEATNSNVEPRFRAITYYLRTRGRRRGNGRLNRWLENINNKRVRRRDLDPEFKRDLQVRLLPEVERLSRALDRDLVRLWGYGGLST